MLVVKAHKLTRGSADGGGVCFLFFVVLSALPDGPDLAAQFGTASGKRGRQGTAQPM